MREAIQRCECGNSQYKGDDHEGFIGHYRYCSDGNCKTLAIERSKNNTLLEFEEKVYIEEKPKLKHRDKYTRDFFRGRR